MANLFASMIHRKHFVLYCFLAFVCIRAALVFLVPLEMWSDAEWYLARAISIASGNGYTENGLPTAYWPVGYPGFLGLLFIVFGQTALVGKIANLVMACATFFLVLHLTRHLFRSETAARIAVLLLTLYPNNAAYTPILLTEIYFTFLFLLGAYLLLTREGWVWAALSGVVFGIATLTKPQFIFLPGLLIALRFLLPQERTAPLKAVMTGVMVYLALVVTLVPWAARNQLVFGERVLISTNGGMSLLVANNPSARGGFVEQDPLVARAGFSVADQVAADRRARALAVEWITENPGRFVALMPLKAWNLWWKDGEAEWAYQAGYAQYERFKYLFRSVRGFNQIYYWFLLGGFFVSIPAFFRLRSETHWPYSAFGFIVIAYFTAISMVFSGQIRYHFPAMPWVIMHVAWMIGYWLDQRAPARARTERIIGSPTS